MLIPPELDYEVYRRLHSDLAHLSDSQLLEHYCRYGNSEGRVSNGLADRQAFASIITPDMSALEISPFAAPLLRGPNVSYCDVFEHEELKRRAVGCGLNPDLVPHIHYTLKRMSLDEIPRQFDTILSSHSIEHQPDLISHLHQVEQRLREGGRYFVLIPDKRYNFDRYNAVSTIADVIQAHEEKRLVHTLKSIITYYALRVHNDPGKHWSERDAERPPVEPKKVRDAIDEWRSANGGYLDTHAWYFTPDSFREIVDLLRLLNFISLTTERLYGTRFGSNEFWVILKKGGEGADA
jgi:SAM-dependent methyltransferase